MLTAVFVLHNRCCTYLLYYIVYENNFLKMQYVLTLTLVRQAAVYALIYVNFVMQNNENLLIHIYT